MSPSQSEINALIALFSAGRYVELERKVRELVQDYPSFGFGWKLLGGALQMQGKNALSAFQKAAELLPKEPDVYFNLGVAMRSAGQFEGAIDSYRKAITIKPDYAEAHGNLGNVLKDLGRYTEAEASYLRATKLKPRDALAHLKLASVLLELGRKVEALSSFSKAIELNPGFIDAHYAAGLIYQELGLYEKAIYSFQKVVEFKPDFANAIYKLASLYLDRGENRKALDFIVHLLRIENRYETRRLFIDCVVRMRFLSVDPIVRDLIIRALAEAWSGPSELARVCKELLKLSPGVGETMKLAQASWPKRLSLKELYGAAGVSLISSDTLLRAFLKSAQICDVEMERFLTLVRFSLLSSIESENLSVDDGNMLELYSAIAQQCFINEYVFSCTEEETELSMKLRQSAVEALESNEQISALNLLAVATYFPLHTLPMSQRLLEFSWPKELDVVLTLQVREPGHESMLRATIPKLNKIDDDVSLSVQHQYEENPYPRWIRVEPFDKTFTLDSVIQRKFPHSLFRPLGKSKELDILIAGCGTGQHPINTGRVLSGARVLAIDLSLSSLSYAKRKTREMGLDMIEYAQADIMKMGSHENRYDLIESIGVLHHMADPFAGWRILMSLLRPGGLMHLGFYSEIARRGVVFGRKYIAEKGYGSSVEDIRQCRQELLDLDEGKGLGVLLGFNDFFSTSDCRDLLFHVQEHRMTIGDLASFIRTNNLQFLGFDLRPEVLESYMQEYPGDSGATNLENWEKYENDHKDTFIQMYQFWVQKHD